MPCNLLHSSLPPDPLSPLALIGSPTVSRDPAKKAISLQSQEKLDRLYFEILFTQPAFWVHQFQLLEKRQSEMSDIERAAHLAQQGRECLAKNNSSGLQNVVRQLWNLLPSDVAQAVQRGYQSSLSR